MRRSQLFAETLRENPADTDVAGNQLLIRGGFIQVLAAGIYSFLPLGERVRQKAENIMRAEMNAIGGQELSLPVVHPAEIWQETGRWHDIGAEMVRFKDRGNRDMVLAMTHEEVIADLLRKQIRSYRQLPVMLYQFQTKFRDEPRARGGLIRVREFVMKDGYSCHTSFADLDRYYPLVYRAYFNIFTRAGIDVTAVQSDVGMMGGTMAHEFMFLSEIGEDQLIICKSCGYSANRQVATFQKERLEDESIEALEEVATPNIRTIADLASFLNISRARTAKAAFFMAGERLIFAVVRGDMDVNETKLTNAVGATDLRPARADELVNAGIVAGFASPIGVTGTTVVVDDAVAATPNLVAGANREGFHLLNTNVGRDYDPDVITDIAAACEGAACPVCGAGEELVRGVEVGNIFKLGTKYSRGLNATFLDEDGQSNHIVMGSYGIGVGRLIACVAEACRDNRGLIWPVSLAPYDVYLVGLDPDDDTVRDATLTLYEDLQSAGVEVLYDDRKERAGVKFNDADLLGMPLRLTVSKRTMQTRSVELKMRTLEVSQHVPSDAAVRVVQEELSRLKDEIQDRVLSRVIPSF